MQESDAILTVGHSTRPIEQFVGLLKAHGVERVVDVRVALMCAEAVPWRCHRSLIADALLVRGVPSEDIAGPARRTPHKLTPFARVEGVRVTYPPL